MGGAAYKTAGSLAALLDLGVSPKIAENKYEAHGHPRTPVGSVPWHFHNYEHGYQHCTGSKAKPYNITEHPEGHLIDVPEAVGHGRNRKPIVFRFPKKLDGGYLLEAGEPKTAALQGKEFAPGIPANRKIHKIPKVKNPQPWTLAIQKHDADKAGTHFDLRLIPPKGNKAHSWAIPKAKLPKRGVMQLAIQQPTHTKEYATTFSGKIPKGTYGAGKVTMHTNEPVTVLSAGDNRVKFRRASGEQFTLFRTKEKQWGITKTAAEVIDEWRRKKREAKVTAFIRERMR